MTSQEEYELESAVRGFHVYKLTWTPVIGEELTAEREPGNSEDRFAVAQRLVQTIIRDSINSQTPFFAGPNLNNSYLKIYIYFLRCELLELIRYYHMTGKTSQKRSPIIIWLRSLQQTYASIQPG